MRLGGSLRMLDRPSDNDIAAIRAWNRAADQNNFLGFAYLHDLKVLHGHPFIAHVTRHAHVFPNSPRSRTVTNRANAPVRFRPVRRSLSLKVVPFHHALESFAFRSADYVHIVAGLK